MQGTRFQSFTANRFFIRAGNKRKVKTVRNSLPGLRKPQEAMLSRHSSHCGSRSSGDFVPAAASALEFDLASHDVGFERCPGANRATRRIISRGFLAGRHKSYHAVGPKTSILADRPESSGRRVLSREGMLKPRCVRPRRLSYDTSNRSIFAAMFGAVFSSSSNAHVTNFSDSLSGLYRITSRGSAGSLNDTPTSTPRNRTKCL